jgi:2-polyprenyl-6-methoxyphenol hydroxylase-like FAD-dependent oxidoreductase
LSAQRALVLGSGVAGLTSAHLLAARGWHVDCGMSPPTPGPVVIISRANADLLRELWHADETLFAGAHRLRARVVQWEGAADPMNTAAPALVMPVNVLQGRLAERAAEAGLRFVAHERLDPARYDWVIQAGGREAASGESIAFGCRRGIAVSVKLTSRARTDRALIESVPGGWLIVIPQGLGRGTLQAIFADRPADRQAQLHALLAQSQATSALVEEIVGEPVGFAAMPRLAVTPCVSGSIAVGDAAIALDPLSGNGIGSGLRSAILATAVLEAAAEDAAPQACFDHYTQRLRQTMRSHVKSCVEFYGRAAHATGWRAEIDLMSDALHRLPAGSDVAAFMLNDGHLERVTGTVEPEVFHAG